MLDKSYKKRSWSRELLDQSRYHEEKGLVQQPGECTLRRGADISVQGMKDLVDWLCSKDGAGKINWKNCRVSARRDRLVVRVEEPTASQRKEMEQRVQALERLQLTCKDAAAELGRGLAAEDCPAYLSAESFLQVQRIASAMIKCFVITTRPVCSIHSRTGPRALLLQLRAKTSAVFGWEMAEFSRMVSGDNYQLYLDGLSVPSGCPSSSFLMFSRSVSIVVSVAVCTGISSSNTFSPLPLVKRARTSSID